MLRFVLILVLLFGALYYGFTSTRTGQDFLLERFIAATMSARAEPFDGLRVFMCGTSSPLPGPGRAQSCVAISAGERLYIVDAGAGSTLTLNLGGVPMYQLKSVLLTHFHSDHIAAVGDINLASWVAGRPEPLVVMGPTGVDRIVNAFNELYALDRGYRVAHHGADLLPPALGVMEPRTIRPGVVLDDGGLRITAFEVDHAPVEPSLGYRFDYRGRSVVVSGDSVATDTLIQAAQGADLLLHDAISLPIVRALEQGARAAGRDRQAKILHDIQGYHASTDSLAAVASAANVRQLAVYHLVPPPRNFLMEKIFRRDLPWGTIVTEDGMTFDLPADEDSIRVRSP
jgi:ribonuclease Z